MALVLFNYLSRKKEQFEPIKKNKVGFYTCGPTVYDRVHIGNLRTYIFEDILKKTLELNNYEVTHVMNITDIDDKIIKKMETEKKTLEEITEPYTKLFLEDIKKLNIKEPDHLPKATEYTKKMLNLAEELLKKGFAYKSDDGTIYFDISKSKKYGQLSNLDKREIKHGARIDSDEYDKQDPGDFAVWKTTPFDRPGWHIECSVMSMKYLGETFDIHAGAIDLLFPHHENEIALSEASTGKKFVNYWIEGEHLLVDNKKMSKSLDNFYTLEDIEEKGFNPLVFRYLTLNTHYRNKMNFTWKSLKSAQNGLKHLQELVNGLGKEKGKINQKFKEEFTKKINDDLNMPQALAVVQKLLKSDLPNKDKLATILDFDEVLGLDLLSMDTEITEEINKLKKGYDKERQEKNYQKSDKLREEIKQLGWGIKDGPKESSLFPL